MAHRRSTSNNLENSRKLRIELLEDRRVLSASTAPVPPTTEEGVEWVATSKQTPPPVSLVLDGEILGLPFWRFSELTPQQVPLLSTDQIATIPDTIWFYGWTAESRAALTQPQVQALRVATISIGLLTAQQQAWLTVPQIETLPVYEYKNLIASQIPKLSTAQIASITNDYMFAVEFSAAQRAAVTQLQVQALAINPSGTFRIAWLSQQQAGWLTQQQIHKVIADDFHELPASQIPFLSLAQVSSIDQAFTFGAQFSAAQCAALTQAQIQVVQAAKTRIGWMTVQQRGWLTVSQIQSLEVYDFHELPASQIPFLSLAQISSVDQAFTFGAEFRPDQAAALTQAQIQVVQVATARLSWMTVQQRSWLTVPQIQSILLNDIPLLLDEQIPSVAPAQFAQMQNLFFIGGFSDAVRANLTRAQLMALPNNVLSSLMVEVELYPPTNYTPAIHGHHHVMDPPMPGTMAADAYRITRVEDATHVALSSGDWSNPSTWVTGQVPGSGAKVFIGAGKTVRFDATMTSAIKTLRIDGMLTFATNANTTLRVDTIVVGATGKLHIGTQQTPIADNVTARVIIPDGGPIDTVWDPGLASRGLISRGEVRMFGRVVTPYATLSANPLQGATSLSLTQAPVGWRVGDELVIAGTNPIGANFDSERVLITSIVGTQVLLNRPLTYSHDGPAGFGFTIQVANLNRNIQFVAEEQTVAQERPHIAFIESPNAWVENVLVQGFGRTDKTRPVTDPVVVNGVLQSGGANPRARYALHFHHTGVNPAEAPGILRGNAVVGGPGWGYVNHQSNVVMENNVAVDVLGAAFVAEDGNEIGVMRGNLAMNAKGTGPGGPLSRKTIHDFGHNGHGFWLQGPGIELIDNIVTGTSSGAYTYFTASSKSMYDAINLSDPSLAMGRDAIPVQTAPIKRFEGNTSYGVNQSLEIWFHQASLTDGESFIDDFTTWNTKYGIQLFYSGNITVRNATLVGRLDRLPDTLLASPLGVGVNRGVHDIVFENLRVEGFVEGMVAPPRRATVIEGGRFANIRNLVIAKGQDTIRSVHVTAPIEFVPLAPSVINGRESYDVSVIKNLAAPDNLDRQVNSLFSDDDLRMVLGNGTTVRLYYADQAAGIVPFPTVGHAQIEGFPPEYAGKTNSQLWQSYGLWFNGGDLPISAYTPQRFEGLAVTEGAVPPGGDFNVDGMVDGFDFLSLQRGFGTPNATLGDGDADNDNDVDANDLAVWNRSFSSPTAQANPNGSGFVAAVAEAVDLDTTPATTPSLADLAMAQQQILATSADRKLSKIRRFVRPPF